MPGNEITGPALLGDLGIIICNYLLFIDIKGSSGLEIRKKRMIKNTVFLFSPTWSGALGRDFWENSRTRGKLMGVGQKRG
jgi:hypothetical protein